MREPLDIVIRRQNSYRFPGADGLYVGWAGAAGNDRLALP